LSGEDLLLPKIPKTAGTPSVSLRPEAAVDQVHSVPTSRQKEEMFVLKKIDHLQESKGIIHASKGGVIVSQRIFKLHGFFGESSLRSFFPREQNSSFQEEHLELIVMQAAILDFAEINKANRKTTCST
jgi:hypothetical protein